jgi:hypothetical protein
VYAVFRFGDIAWSSQVEVSLCKLFYCLQLPQIIENKTTSIYGDGKSVVGRGRSNLIYLGNWISKGNKYINKQ